ncbi:MAG: hypothetical protein U5L45_06525 [Saprospiraceae bacterium]|nr:hypothetical protein [Saprospiraceae bacterium]
MVRFSGFARKRTTFSFFASEVSYGLSSYVKKIKIYTYVNPKNKSVFFVQKPIFGAIHVAAQRPFSTIDRKARPCKHAL